MLRARVVGNVWSTRRLDELPGGALLDVETDGGTRLVALDVLGCGIGEQVLVVTGSVAAAWFEGKPPPVDALVIGSVDEPSSSAPAVEATAAAPAVEPAPPTPPTPPTPSAPAGPARRRRKASTEKE